MPPVGRSLSFERMSNKTTEIMRKCDATETLNNNNNEQNAENAEKIEFKMNETASSFSQQIHRSASIEPKSPYPPSSATESCRIEIVGSDSNRRPKFMFMCTRRACETVNVQVSRNTIVFAKFLKCT